MQRQFEITTYEITSEGQLNPVLTHVFWGHDLQQAIGYAKSHLITDDFFSASFEGGMPWKGSILRMTNEGKIIDRYTYSDPEEVIVILDKLGSKARHINRLKDELGIIRQIQILADISRKYSTK